jgi:hypothetical protein
MTYLSEEAATSTYVAATCKFASQQIVGSDIQAGFVAQVWVEAYVNIGPVDGQQEVFKASLPLCPPCLSRPGEQVDGAKAREGLKKLAETCTRLLTYATTTPISDVAPSWMVEQAREKYRQGLRNLHQNFKLWQYGQEEAAKTAKTTEPTPAEGETD